MIERHYLSDAPFVSVNPGSHGRSIVNLKHSKYIFLLISFVYIVLSILFPVLLLTMQSLSGGIDTIIRAFSLLSSNIVDSVIYSLIGAALLTLFGFTFAYMSERENIRHINLILLITFAVPSTVLGLGLIKFFNTPALSFIYSGFWIIIIGYTGRFIFITEKIIANSIKQVPRSLEESASIMGAGFFSRTGKIMIPIISGGIFSAFIISFIFCLGELGTTILVYPPGTSVMPVKVYTITANAPQSLTSAMSLIVLSITLFLLIFLFMGHKIFFRNKWS